MRFFIINSNASLVSAIEQSLQNDRAKFFESGDLATVIDDIRNSKAQIVVVNWSKGDFNAIDAIRKIKRIRSGFFIHVIVIITKEFQKDIERLIDAGADDFILKPFTKDDFAGRILIADKVTKTENNFLKTKKKLIKLAREDSLTGILNRRALLDEVLKEMGRSVREKKSIATILVRIANFREIIDEKGSMVGDMLLIDLSNRLQASCRPYDKLGRYGVAEFLIVLPDTGAENAEHVVKRFLESIETTPLEITDLQSDILLGIGLSELTPQGEGKNITSKEPLRNDIILDRLLKRTEEAASTSEARGNNRLTTIHE